MHDWATETSRRKIIHLIREILPNIASGGQIVSTAIQEPATSMTTNHIHGYVATLGTARSVTRNYIGRWSRRRRNDRGVLQLHTSTLQQFFKTAAIQGANDMLTIQITPVKDDGTCKISAGKNANNVWTA